MALTSTSPSLACVRIDPQKPASEPPDGHSPDGAGSADELGLPRPLSEPPDGHNSDRDGSADEYAVPVSAARVCGVVVPRLNADVVRLPLSWCIQFS